MLFKYSGKYVKIYFNMKITFPIQTKSVIQYLQLFSLDVCTRVARYYNYCCTVVSSTNLGKFNMIIIVIGIFRYIQYC